jgi:peptide/nickel transport system permease protein
MPTFWIGAVLLIGIVLISTLGASSVDQELLRLDGSRMNIAPCAEYPLGTQSEGRDMLSLLIVGSGVTLKIGLIAGAIAIVVGTALGLIAGYCGGKTDSIISAIVDTGMTIPPLAIMILIAASISSLSVAGMGIIIAITAWMQPTRVIRSQMLSMKERNYVQMAKISNVSGLGIVFKEIMPNLLPFLACTFVNAVSTAILSSIGLEVLGLGSQQSNSLGVTIYFAIYYSAMWRGLWWWWLPPIIVIVLIFVSLFLISVGLDELGNPKLKRL